jgi:hypothetical protein
MTILSVNTFSSVHPALSDPGTDKTDTGNDQAFGGSEEPCFLSWPPGLYAVAGGLIRGVLDEPCVETTSSVDGASELKKGGPPSPFESLGGAHPIAHRPID